MPRKLTRETAAKYIENFFNGKGDPWDWDDFTCGGKTEDEELDRMIELCRMACEWYPSGTAYCNDRGVERMEIIVKCLRGEADAWDW